MKFRYVATDKTGKRFRGDVEADSSREARQLLRERQLIPHQLKKVGDHNLTTHAIRQRDFVLMMRQLATLTGANLPLVQSLSALENQSDAHQQKAFLRALRQRVQEGCSLAEVAAQWPKNFTPLYCAMIAAGESSGKLSYVLEQLADYSEKMLQLKQRLLQSMVYPLLLTCVALLVIVILLTAVVPEIVGQFTYMQQQLPLSTRLLMQASDSAQRYGLYLFSLAVVVAGGGYLALRRPACQQWWHRSLLHIPVLGRLTTELGLARYAQALSILINSAVPLLEGMAISANVLSNLYIRQQLGRAQERVKEGAALTQALDETGLLTPMMRHMIASGEQSGELGIMLKRTADIQQQRFVNKLTLVVSTLEPLLIVMLSGIVLFIILAILQPILELNNLTG